MNAALITNLEIIRDKLISLESVSGEGTVGYEVVMARVHVDRAIELEKNRPTRHDLQKFRYGE